MKLRFASIAIVFALVAAGCGKDKPNDEKSGDDDVIAGEKGKSLVPNAGYHADTSSAAGKSEVAVSGRASERDDGADSDDESPPAPDDELDDPPPPPKTSKPKPKRTKKSDGKQKTSVDSVGALKLNDIAIAPDVVDRVPQDVKRRYSEAPEVFWCWTNFSNSGEETKVTHVWRHKNKVRSKIEVTVGAGKRWRSWSRHHPDASGEWSCEILDPDGKRLGRAAVTVGS